MNDVLFILTTFLISLSLWGGWATELCYIDQSSQQGVYCSNNCCGDYPQTYCCDKDQYIAQSAAFGGLGVLFLVVMVTCCVVRKVKRKPKVDPLAAIRKPPLTGSDGPVVSAEDRDLPKAKNKVAPAANDLSGESQEPPPQPTATTTTTTTTSNTTTTTSPPPGHQSGQLPSQPMYEDASDPHPAAPVYPKATPTPSPR